MIRFTVGFIKASLSQNVAVIIMSPLLLFDIMFIATPTLFKALKFSVSEPL